MVSRAPRGRDLLSLEQRRTILRANAHVLLASTEGNRSEDYRTDLLNIVNVGTSDDEPSKAFTFMPTIFANGQSINMLLLEGEREKTKQNK